MKELKIPSTQAADQTPIDVLLGIDDDGMTTAKKLYDFLELAPSNYSKWCSTNIIRNKFAEEDKDYFHSSSSTSKNLRGNFAKDYKLTSEFAKQLSMLSKSERGEQARQYFLACEKGLKIAMKRFSSQQTDLQPLLCAILKTQCSIKELQSSLTQQIQDNYKFQQQQFSALTALFTSTLPRPYKPQFTRWMDKTFKKVDSLAEYSSCTRKQMLCRLYTEFQDVHDIDLNEYTHEYCASHNLQNVGIYTMNVIGADKELKLWFDLMLQTLLDQIPTEAMVSAAELPTQIVQN